MVGTTGFEPATSSVSRKRSNQLSYAPKENCRVSPFVQTRPETSILLRDCPAPEVAGCAVRKTGPIGSLTGLTEPAKMANRSWAKGYVRCRKPENRPAVRRELLYDHCSGRTHQLAQC